MGFENGYVCDHILDLFVHVNDADGLVATALLLQPKRQPVLFAYRHERAVLCVYTYVC